VVKSPPPLATACGAAAVTGERLAIEPSRRRNTMAAVRSCSSAPGHKRITACRSTLPAWLTMISTTRCTHSCTPMRLHPHAENGNRVGSAGHRS
jgi:hypothetical protein